MIKRKGKAKEGRGSKREEKDQTLNSITGALNCRAVPIICISLNNLWQFCFLQFCIKKTCSFHSTEKLNCNIHPKVNHTRVNFFNENDTSFSAARHSNTNRLRSFSQFFHCKGKVTKNVFKGT